MGCRHLVGDPDPGAGDPVLSADGGVTAACSVIARSTATTQSIDPYTRMNGLLRGACHRLRVRAARNDDDKKRAGAARSFQFEPRLRCYAACLCIAPEADAVPRIALIERSIAAHSRLISAAARPSA